PARTAPGWRSLLGRDAPAFLLLFVCAQETHPPQREVLAHATECRHRPETLRGAHPLEDADVAPAAGHLGDHAAAAPGVRVLLGVTLPVRTLPAAPLADGGDPLTGEAAGRAADETLHHSTSSSSP